MAIIRTARPEQFTIISNSIIEDMRLNWQDMAILIYLLSKPDNWEVSPSHLMTLRNLKRDAIYKSLNNLCDIGYANKSPNPKGGWDWKIYDTPHTENTESANNAESVKTRIRKNPHTEKTTQTNTDFKTNTEGSFVSACEEKNYAIENSKNQQLTKSPTTSMEWVSYFINQQGFKQHEAQTAKTVPMFVEWVKNGYTLEDVEQGIMGAMGWLSQKGETRAKSPCLFDGFIKTAISARQSQQAQKSPLEGNQAGFNKNHQSSSSGANYDTDYDQYQQNDNSIAAQQARGIKRMQERHARERAEREALGTTSWGAQQDGCLIPY